MKHDAHLANDLVIRSLIAKVEKLEAAIDARVSGYPPVAYAPKVLRVQKTGRPTDTAILAGRLSQRQIQPSDLDYMACAILEMSDEVQDLRDENRALRDRLTSLEERLGL